MSVSWISSEDLTPLFVSDRVKLQHWANIANREYSPQMNICEAKTTYEKRSQFGCSRVAGHPGPHIAMAGRSHLCAVWDDQERIYGLHYLGLQAYR